MLHKDNNGLYFLIDDKSIYKFSEHFSVAEMFATKYKQFSELNYQNVSQHTILNLIRLCNVLEVIRHFLGDTELHLSSAYRCPALNFHVGGVYNSYHTTGNAADIIVPPTEHVLSFLRKLQNLHLLNEVIAYRNSIHISIPDYRACNEVFKYRTTINGKC